MGHLNHRSPVHQTLTIGLGTLLVAVLLPRPLTAEAPSKPPMASLNAKGYTIRVDEVRRLKDPQTVAFKPSGYPIQANRIMDRNTQISGHSSRNTSGSASGGGSSGGSAYASSGTDRTIGSANLIVDLRVIGARDKRHQVLCTALGKVTALDDQGYTIDAQDLPAHLKYEIRDYNYPRGSECVSIHMNLKNTEAHSIKSMAGELLVADANVQTTPFEGKELTKETTHALNGVSVRLENIESDRDGIHITASVSLPDSQTDKLNFNNMQNRLHVVLEDSNGKIHEARSASGGGSSGGSGSGTSRNRKDKTRDATAMTSSNLQFAPLPEGVTIRKVIFTTTELLGSPQRIPFQFSDLALPAATVSDHTE